MYSQCKMNKMPPKIFKMKTCSMEVHVYMCFMCLPSLYSCVRNVISAEYISPSVNGIIVMNYPAKNMYTKIGKRWV